MQARCGRHLWWSARVLVYYASPSSGEAYRDRRLTTNFELWVEFFCVPTCFHMRIPKPCQSVRLCWSVRTPRKKPPWLCRYQSYISNWCINGKVFTSTTIWKSKKLIFFFFKVRNWRNWILSVEKKSPWIRQYQSYISNWFINGKVLTSTAARKHKNLNCFQKSSKLNFDLCQRAEIAQVDLNMNLYDGIGDASSSLRGSTSSLMNKGIYFETALLTCLIKYSGHASESFRWIWFQRLSGRSFRWTRSLKIPSTFITLSDLKWTPALTSM